MICKNCGAALPHEGVAFCPKCGTKCVQENPNSMYGGYNTAAQTYYPEEPMKPKQKKKGKAKIIILSIIGSVAAILLVLAILFITSPAYKIYEKLNNKEYSESVSLYNAEVKDNWIQQTILDILLNGRVDKTATKYNDGEIDYDYASSELNALKAFGYENAEEKLGEITEANEADESYKKADEYYKQGDYEKAIDEFSKIPEGNENYENAQKMLEQVYAAYINKTVEKVTQYNDGEQYKDAVSLINATLEVLPEGVNVAELQKALEESMAGYKTQVSAEVAKLLEENNYEEAFDAIDEALDFSQDDFFSQLMDSTVEGYVAYITKTVEGYMKKNDFNSAIKVVSNALEELPDNKELKELKERVEKETPTDLSELVVIDSRDYSYKDEVFTDSFGDDYDGYHWFDPCYNNAYAVYNLNDNYTKFNCSIVAAKSTGSSRELSVAIYLDGKLAYTLKDFTKTTGRKDISLDVSNVTKMEIKTGADDYSYSQLAMVNATVK